MKKVALISLLFLFTISTFSQNKIQENKEKIWYGVDLSNAYLIGGYGFKDYKILNSEFKKLNYKVVNEYRKYKLGSTLRQRNLTYDFSQIFKSFDNIDFSKNIKNQIVDSKITYDDLQNIINGYTFKDKNKIGVIYIVEELNKTNETATVVVTSFDTNTKKIISAKRYKSIASGIGLASHWANSIYRINNKIRYDNRILLQSVEIKNINL